MRAKLAPACFERTRFRLLLIATAVLAGLQSAQAQLPQTRIYALFPPGGQVGTAFDVTITSGADLEEVSRLLFTHPGITATQKTQDVGGQSQPIANAFTVTVSGETPPGQYEVRAVGLYGISNPRFFSIGNRPEVLEVEPNNLPEQAQVIEIGKTINARVTGGAELDHYKFAGKQGQRIVGELFARRIDSKLDAAVEIYDPSGRRLTLARNNVAGDPLVDVILPVDGDYLVRVYDFVYSGGEDYFYRLTFHTGPYIDYVFPPAGVPGSTGTFTLYGRNLPGGQPSGVTTHGRPLDKLDVQIAVPADALQIDPQVALSSQASAADSFVYRWASPAGLSNPVVIGFAPTAPAAEVEPNNAPAESQKVTVPVEIAGQFQARGDVDGFTFDAKAGQVFFIEAQAQRLGSPADPYLTIDQVTVNDKGEETVKRLGAADDDGVNPLPVIFETLSDDPVYKLAIPADGLFRVTVRDRYGASRGDSSLVYRLSIRPETPDFRLVAVPNGPIPANTKQPMTWAAGLRRGDNLPVDVLSVRRDSFAGVIEITAEGLPPGVTCAPISLGPTQLSGVLVFTAAEDAPPFAGTVKIVGKSTVTTPGGPQELVRQARVGTVVWNGVVNQPSETRAAQALELSVIEETAPFQIKHDVLRVEANHSRQILIPVSLVRRNGFDNAVTMTWVGTPPNVQIENKAIDKGQDSGLFRVFVPPNAPVGTYELHMIGAQQVSYRRNPAKADKAKVEFDEAAKVAAAAAEANKAAVAARDEAVKKVPDAQSALKVATDAKAAADKALTDAQAAEKAAAEAVQAAGDNADAKAAAEKLLQEAQAKVKAAADAIPVAEKARADADAAVKQAEATKAATEQAAKDADAKAKATEAARVAAEKKSKDAEAASKAANINFLPSSPALVLTIRNAPYTLTAAPADGGNVKIGGKIEVKVDLKRINNFAGPATLTLSLPPGTLGVKAEPVTVPADKNEGVLVIEAAADAPEATIANAVVTVQADFEGKAAVDVAIPLKVVK